MYEEHRGDEWVMETKRLGFRRLTQGDCKGLGYILGDPDTMYAWEYGFTTEQIAQFVDRATTCCMATGHAYHAAILKETGELVGVMGLLDEDIDGNVQLGLGYIVGKKHWGCGYAAEGAGGWLEYAFSVLGTALVIAEIRPENAPSRRVAERLGMVVTGEYLKYHNGKAMPHLIYSTEKKS